MSNIPALPSKDLALASHPAYSGKASVEPQAQ
jgi:hypothetical protein